MIIRELLLEQISEVNFTVQKWESFSKETRLPFDVRETIQDHVFCHDMPDPLTIVTDNAGFDVAHAFATQMYSAVRVSFAFGQDWAFAFPTLDKDVKKDYKNYVLPPSTDEPEGFEGTYFERQRLVFAASSTLTSFSGVRLH